MIYIATSETVEAVKENAFAHAGVVHVAILLAAPLAAGIYRVATLPAYRDRGLGRALTVAAMQSTRRAGYATAILFATPSASRCTNAWASRRSPRRSYLAGRARGMGSND